MRIAVLARTFPNRSETFIRNHALGLVRRGHDVTVISRRPGDGISPNEILAIEQEGVQLEYLRTATQTPLWGLCQIGNLIKQRPSSVQWLGSTRQWENFVALFFQRSVERIRPTIVHVHFGTTARAIHEIGFRFPVVVTWHGYDANVMPRLWEMSMYRALFASLWKHTVGSRFMYNRLLQLGANKSQVFLNPMGVDLGQFSFKEHTYKGERPLRILSVGRLAEEKGHSELVQAVSALLDAGASLQLRIIGDGPLRLRLNRQVARTGHAKAVQLLGSKRHHEVISELHQSDLFCLTGKIGSDGAEEGQGLAFAEAQAVGVPVIGSAIGGVGESFLDGETGVLALPGDVESIRRAILFFIEDPQNIYAFGCRGRKFVERKFSIDRMLDQFEEIYKSF